MVSVNLGDVTVSIVTIHLSNFIVYIILQQVKEQRKRKPMESKSIRCLKVKTFSLKEAQLKICGQLSICGAIYALSYKPSADTITSTDTLYSHCLTPRPIQKPIKMGCTELCGDIHTAQRQTSTEIPIGFCANLSVSVSVSVSASMLGSVNTP